MVAIEREVALYEYEHRQFDEQLFSRIDKIDEEASFAGVNMSETLRKVRRLAHFSAEDPLPELDE